MKQQPVKHFENHGFRNSVSRYFVQESCTVIGGGVGGSPKQKKTPLQTCKGMRQQVIFIWERMIFVAILLQTKPRISV